MKSERDFRLGQMMLLAAVFLSFISTTFAAPPVVTNVRASQRAGSKFVDIYYDLSDPDSTNITVSIQVSYDAGSTWTVPAYTFTGAFGGNITPGVNRYVVWNAGVDWDGQFTSQCRVRVSANDLDADGVVLIPSGSFTMGDTFATVVSSETPIHSVYISAFYIEKTEVSQARWNSPYLWGISHGYSFNNSGLSKGTNHPVHTVNWYDVVKWCNARSELEGRTPCYYNEAGLATIYKTGTGTPYVKWTANGYRLPTEAEWEKAARGGSSGKRFPWGNTITHNQANYYANTNYFYDLSLTQAYNPLGATGSLPYTTPVGSFPPNGYGLYDMAGNLWELCWDWFDSSYYNNAGATQTDTRGPVGPLNFRVVRGGVWDINSNGGPNSVCCASRFWLNPTAYSVHFGFRCVRGL